MKKKLFHYVALAFLLVIGVGVLTFIVKNNNAGQRDFVTYWVAGQQLVHGRNPYDFAAAFPMEKALKFPLDHPLVMRNPPTAFFLVAPLGFLSPNAGLMFWFVLLLVSLVLSVRMAWQMNGSPDDRLHLLGYCFPPLMECMMTGQFGIILLLGITGFFYFHKTRPMIAGAFLLLCVSKPHLFVPFGIVLLLWTVLTRSYRILAGAVIALLASAAFAVALDPHAWMHYREMLQTAGIGNEILPTLAENIRLLVHGPVWTRFIPEAFGCSWAFWYYLSHREDWDFMHHGMIVLLVGVACSPYAFFTDESLLVPVVLAAAYRALNTGRSLIPLGVLLGAAMMEVFANLPLITWYYAWTPLAWLGWYLYATWKHPVSSTEISEHPAIALS